MMMMTMKMCTQSASACDAGRGRVGHRRARAGQPRRSMVGDDSISSMTPMTPKTRTRTMMATPLVPKEVLDAIRVPPEVVEIRAYVRWEEAGMPSDTTDAWRQREYDEALLDLKIELLSGVTMNEIRGRYKLEPVEGGDARMFNPDEELARRVAAAEALASGASSGGARRGERDVRDARDEAVDFIESVVSRAPIVDAVEDVVIEEEDVEEEEEDIIAAATVIVADDEEVGEEDVVAIINVDDCSADVIDMDQIIDVFSALSPEEIEDMEKAMSGANWSTREQLITAIRADNVTDDDDTDDEDGLNDELRRQLELSKSALASSEQALAMTKKELEDLEVDIVTLQATSDKALQDMKIEWAAEVESLEAQIKQASAISGANDGDIAKQHEAFVKKIEDAERVVAAMTAENEKLKSDLDAAKTAAIRADAMREASAEVVLMLKKDLESTRAELKDVKANAVSEVEFAAMKKELDNAWVAAAELQEMWDGDRKVIELLTKSITDENAKREARKAMNIPDAYKGVLSWARKTITRRAADVSSVTETTLNTVTAAYQELDASTGEFSDDVIPEDPSESEFMPR
jgi:hypothetical protein